jgi:uncharacterized protein (TIGR02594 family)
MNATAGAAAKLVLNKQHPGDPSWLVEALRLDGIKETPGKAHNPEVVKMFAEAGHPQVKDDETAWCAAFVGAMLLRGGYAGTGKLTARSYLEWGEPVTTPQRGDVVVFPRGNSTWQGHVAFVLKADDQWVHAFGGNQSNAVNVTRYSRANVLGFRRPSSQNKVGFDMIEQVQAALKKAGYVEVGEIDGIAGPKTRAAIMRFEREHGLAATGKPTRELLAHILASKDAKKPTGPVILPTTPNPPPPDIPWTEPVIPVSPKKGGLGWLWIVGAAIAAILAFVAFVPIV